MPGIPRSRACAPCKVRRTKCDQNWPICSQCARTKRNCPGPSTLIKFITVKGSEQGKRRQASNPQPTLLSASDLVAGRLVHHLDGAKERMVVHVEPFKCLPTHLARSACLRDAAALLCTIWDNYQRNERQPPFSEMSAYWKVIHSLGRTLKSSEAYTVDTLASITVIQQAELYFDPGNLHYQHEKGVLALLSQVGPPKPGDKFHARLALAAYVLLVPHWITSAKGHNVFDTPEWTSAFAASVCEYLNAKEDRPVFEEGFKLYNALCVCLPRISNAIKAATAFSHGLTSSRPPDVTKLIQQLSDRTEQGCNLLIQRMTDRKHFTEEEDPESPVGSKYWVSTPNASQFILGMVAARIIILLASLKWNSLQQAGDRAVPLFAALRAACITVWKLIPFLRQSDLLTVPLPWQTVSLTFAFANAREKKYILDVLSELDTFQRMNNTGKRVPRSRASIEKEINRQAAILSV